MATTANTHDFLGRALQNATPGVTDPARDYLGRVTATGNKDFLGRALITVTARWGWQNVPSGIVEATLDVAQMMYLKTSLQAGAVRSETISGFSVSWGAPNGQGSSDSDGPPEMVNALPFRRKRFGVA